MHNSAWYQRADIDFFFVLAIMLLMLVYNELMISMGIVFVFPINSVLIIH